MRTLKSILAAVALLALPLFGLAAESVAPAVQETLHAATNAVGEAAGHAADAAHAAGAHAEHHAEGLPAHAPVLVDLGFFKVTNSMVVTWIVAIFLIVGAQMATSKLQRVPSGLQNFAEWVVESLENFLAGLLGHKLARETFWFYASVFLFILFANWFGLIPGVGSIGWGVPDAEGHLHHLSRPVFRGANADLNMTSAMSIVFFVAWIYWAVKANGVGGTFSHIFGYHGDAVGGMKAFLILVFLMVGLLEVVSILFRPVSLSFRLYGNIFAGENLLEAMAIMGGKYFGWLVPLPFYFLELLVGFVQALVFTLLTAIFTQLICSHGDGDHAHEEAGHEHH
ncbi:MAG TPA: F0F1 ATP synthase subunit A [Verrucomicrobiae bacterium]